MKKIMLTLAALLSCAFATTVFTACGSDDKEDIIKPSVEEATPTQMALTFTLDATDDMTNYFDMVVTFDDGTGEKQEAFTALEWSKTLTANLPAIFTFSRKIRVKEDKRAALAAAETVEVTTHYHYAFKILDAQGQIIPEITGSKDVAQSMIVDTGAKAMERADAGVYDRTYICKFDVNGSRVVNGK